MASVFEITGRRGTTEYSRRGLVRRFLVTTDNNSDGPYVARSLVAANPHNLAPGRAHPQDAALICDNVDIDEVDGIRTQFIATGNYTSETPQEDPGQVDNPLAEPADVEFGVSYRSMARSHDINGNAIVNSLGDPIDGVECELADGSIVITRNEPEFQRNVYGDFVNSINSGFWEGFSPRTVRCMAITGQRRFFTNMGTNQEYWVVRYEFNSRLPVSILQTNGTPAVASQWDALVMNTSFFNGAGVRFTDAGGKDRPYETPIDGAGNEVATPRFIAYPLYLEMDFNDLGLNGLF